MDRETRRPLRDMADLLDLMARLRDPATGCPWDVEQTFETIAPYTIEEAYEVSDAIARRDRDDLCEELGDLLLQVVFHAQMAREEGAFDFSDVVEAITGKLIRRHPHVFGDETARAAGMVREIWDRIKAEERREKARRRTARGLSPTTASRLEEVPLALPALAGAQAVQSKAASVGFDWPDASGPMAKVEEEITELSEAIRDKGDIEGELGDLLFSVVNLARHLGVNAEEALRGASRKFSDRFRHVEERAGDVEGTSLDQLEVFWNEAKRR